MRLLIFSFVTTLLILWSNVFGQDRNMLFSHFAKTQGISDKYISGIVQDNYGFLWIATWDGLNRYDGSSFKIYKRTPEDSTGLGSNGIRSISIDNKGRIWLLCVDGICVYDSEKDKILKYFSNDQAKSNYIQNILCDSKGTLWIATISNGLISIPVGNYKVYSKTKAGVKIYLHDNKDPKSLSSNNALSIFEDKQSNIWISSGSSIVDRYNPRNDNFEHFKIDLPGLDDTNNRIAFQIEDNDDLFWLSTIGAGMISWDRKKNIFKQYKYQLNKNSISSNLISHIRQDKNGILWISTDGGGLSFYNKKSGVFEYCKNDPFNPNSLSGNGTVQSFEDRSGVIWVCTSYYSLNKYEVNKSKFGLHISNPFDKNSVSAGTVTAFLEDKDGNIWIGTDGGGLNLFNKKTNSYQHYTNDSNNPNSINSNTVVCLAEDRDGNIWIGTYAGGLNCFNRKNNKIIRYVHNNADPKSISHNNIFALCADSKNNIWAGTMEGTLNLLDRKTGHFHQYKKKPGNPDSFNDNYMTCIFEDSRHYLWIATSIGLNMIKLNDYDFTKPFPNPKFYHYTKEETINSVGSNNYDVIAEDGESNMWFGTDGFGLVKMDMTTNKIISYVEKDGLVSNNIRGILIDNDNNLWISTTNGISKLNAATKTFRNFNVYDGLQDYRFSRAYAKTKDGQLYFGGGNGYNAFYPKDIIYNKIPPKVIIDDFKVFNKSVRVDEKVLGSIILDKAIYETKKIILSYKINLFAFEFAALDFTSPEKNKYAYKMEGFDNQWRTTDAKNRTATYTNLDAGKYIFRVKASNNDDIWNEEGTSINIIILPPWWRTTLFKLFILLIFTTSIYIAYYLRIEMYRKKQKELTVLVRQRTMEISKANDILLERQTRIEEYAEEQINHTEKLKETNELLINKQKLIESQADQLKDTNQQLTLLNSTKDRFFSIIAHDLRNPFHVVSGFAEVLLNDLEKLPPPKARRFIELIYNSSISGSKLLENLLQWSRSQTGRMSFEPVNISLSTIAEETINLLEGEARGKNITILSLIEADLTVLADENMVKTIFRNLISNAIKFTQKDGSITIKSTKTESRVEVIIADTGVGIPPETLPLLFRIDATVTTKGTSNEMGTGLGLILCKEFVEKHDGKIWVESKVGKGSQFKFTLPLSLSYMVE